MGSRGDEARVREGLVLGGRPSIEGAAPRGGRRLGLEGEWAWKASLSLLFLLIYLFSFLFIA